MILDKQYEVVEVLKNTKLYPLNLLKVGDVLRISVELDSTGRSFNGAYAIKFDLEATIDGERHINTVYGSRLGAALKRFKFK